MNMDYGSDLDYEDYLKFIYDEEKNMKEPKIEYESKIDKFILDSPEGERYYFRDYESAEDFWMLNFKEDVSLNA
jgi:hypothetical protein